MNSDQCFIQQVLQQRKVKSLVHFTPVQNLNSIFSHNLLSRIQCDRLGLKPVTTDAYRLDGLLDFISVSVSFPNSGMFYRKRMSMNYSWAVLLISPDVICRQPSLFFATNAATAKKKKMDGGYSSAAFSAMFGDPDRNSLQGHLDYCFPVDPQAEIMVKQAISINDIQSVVFGSDADYRSWISAGGDLAGQQFDINHAYFSSRQYAVSRHFT
jgi:hypothetical protein